MSLGQRAERLFEAGGAERPADGQHRANVVRRGSRLELFEKPEPLLSKRKHARTFRVRTSRDRHGRGGGGRAALLGPEQESLALFGREVGGTPRAVVSLFGVGPLSPPQQGANQPA